MPFSDISSPTCNDVQVIMIIFQFKIGIFRVQVMQNIGCDGNQILKWNTHGWKIYNTELVWMADTRS